MDDIEKKKNCMTTSWFAHRYYGMIKDDAENKVIYNYRLYIRLLFSNAKGWPSNQFPLLNFLLIKNYPRKICDIIKCHEGEKRC